MCSIISTNTTPTFHHDCESIVIVMLLYRAFIPEAGRQNIHICKQFSLSQMLGRRDVRFQFCSGVSVPLRMVTRTQGASCPETHLWMNTVSGDSNILWGLNLKYFFSQCQKYYH